MTFTLEWVRGASVFLDVQTRGEGAGARPWLQYVPPFLQTVRSPPRELPATLDDVDKLVRPAVEEFIYGYTRGMQSSGGGEAPAPPGSARESLESLGATLAAHLCFDQVKTELARMGAEGIFLYIGTDEQLLHFPLELLFDDSDFLCLRHHVGRYINARDAGTSPRANTVEPGTEIEQLRVLLITVPEPPPRDSRQFEELPEAHAEREAVIQVLGSAGADVTDIYDRNARLANVRDALRDQYHIIHFSGHASFGGGEGRHASLSLYDTDVSVGVLSGELQRQQSMVLCFINGCETARGDSDDGDHYHSEWDQQFNLYGLAKPFLDTGAYFLGTRWRIQDVSARSFASTFYDEFLLQSTPVGRAITKARLATEAEAAVDDPSWASYVFYGDPRLSLMRTDEWSEEPPPQESPGPPSVREPDLAEDPIQQLSNIADEYDDVRSTQSSGPDRTRRMTQLMRRASELGGSLDSFPFEEWHAGTDGRRVVALALMNRERIPRRITMVLDSVSNSRSAFEQYQALDRLSANYESLPAESIPETLSVLRRASEDPRVTGTDRAYLIDDLIGKLGPQSEELKETKFWEPGSTLKVAFLDGSEADHEAVQTIANEWTEGTSIRLLFGADPDDAEIRVRFGGAGSWSYLGTDALAVPHENETMSLATVDRPEVLRMFGHALGLIHEHQIADSILSFDRDRLFEYFGSPPNSWDRATIEAQFLTSYENWYPFDKPLDTESVMLFSFLDEVLHQPLGLEPREQLSEGDKKLIQRLYPPLGS